MSKLTKKLSLVALLGLSFTLSACAEFPFLPTQPTRLLPVTPTTSSAEKGWLNEVYHISKTSPVIASVTALAFSNRGDLLAIGRSDGSFELFDVATRKEVTFLKITGNTITTLAFQPDDKTVAVGTAESGNLSIVEVPSAKVLKTLNLPLKKIDEVSFSPDGRLLSISGSFLDCNCGSSLLIWSLKEDKTIFKSLGATDFDVTTAAFSPDSQSLVYFAITTLGEGSSTYVWSPKRETSPELDEDLPATEAFIISLIFNTKGNLLAGSRILLNEHMVDLTVWSWKTGQVVFKVDEPYISEADIPKVAITQVNFTPDSKFLIATSPGRFVKVWDLATQQPVFVTTDQQAKDLSTTALSKDGLYLAAGYKDGLIRIFGR